MQGEVFDYDVTVDPEIDISNSSIVFSVKDKLGGTEIFNLNTANNTITKVGQVLTMKISALVSATVGDFVCQFIFTDNTTNTVVKSQIGRFNIKQSL